MDDFGPYKVCEQLGEGGMATVHRAVFQGIEGFERTVALKRMRGVLAGDDSFVRGFVREARLAAQLSHTNIAQIYDLGRVDETYYIAMELVPGHDLLRVLRRMAGAGVGAMPVAVALEVLAQICDALDYAHNVEDAAGQPLGLVHRDVSPANLIVGHDGVVRVIDFGIAKAASSTCHTATGIVKGKFSYLPPEAIRAGTVDARGDLFSLGVVAYELLTARPLFKGVTDFGTLEQIRDREVPPPSTINADIWPEVDAIVLRALVKDPAQRWQSAAEMRRAIDAARDRHGVHADRDELLGWIGWAMSRPDMSALAELVGGGDSVVIEVVAPETIVEAVPLAARRSTLPGWSPRPTPKLAPVVAFPCGPSIVELPAPPAGEDSCAGVQTVLHIAATPEYREAVARYDAIEAPAAAPPRRSRKGATAALFAVLCTASAVGSFALASLLA